MIKTNPLLSVAIPTWNRANYLAQTLKRLQEEICEVDQLLVEVIVSDNRSPDDTKSVVEAAKLNGLDIRYICNRENIGSDANIAQCFNEARGKYVLILGDDDLFVDGSLAWLINVLTHKDYGVVCLRPYGFERDFRKEYPNTAGREYEYTNGGDFLVAIGQLVTLISSCVINKSLLSTVDAREFCGGNLVQVHLVIRAALLGSNNLYTNNYYIACKRNNSGGYDFIRVFVEELSKIFDRYKSMGLTTANISAFETHMLLGYFPHYLFRQRLTNIGDQVANMARFKSRFGERWLFHIWLAPILYLPRSLALVWGAVTTVVGRIICGDLWRGIYFVWNKVTELLMLSKGK